TGGGRIDVDGSSSGHRTQPFTHIAFVQTGPRSNILRSQSRLIAYRIEEARAVADGDHQAKGRVVESALHAAGEGFSLLGVKVGTSRHCYPSSGAVHNRCH